MIRLRRFASRLHAEHAAMFLRRGGVQAVVVGDYVNQMFGGPVAPKMLQVELMLVNADQRDEADRLLEVFESEPIELEPGWEDEATPELAGLDLSAFDLTCPGCGYDLGELEVVGLCPECGGEYDAASLIFSRHGPEALEALFTGEPAAPARSPRARCRECKEDLTALPVRGRCPACGLLYDKEAR